MGAGARAAPGYGGCRTHEFNSARTSAFLIRSMPGRTARAVRAGCIDDLIRDHPERENFEKLTDAELLRMAAREVAMALIIIARATQAPAMSLGGVADLLKSVATALDAAGSAFVQALTLRRGG
jgi:hypothetical protein